MLVELQPQLTSVKSTKGLQPPPPADLAHYFRLKAPAAAFKFRDIGPWNHFSGLVCKALTRIDPFVRPTQFMTTTEIALSVVKPILSKNFIEADFIDVSNCSSFFIGSNGLLLCATGAETPVPILIGHSCPDLRLESGFLESVESARQSIEPEWPECVDDEHAELEDGRRHAARALQRLCHTMLMNDLSYGCLSSESCARFVRIVKCDAGLDLLVSPPIKSREIPQAMVAMSIEAYFGLSCLRYERGFDLLPEPVEDPDIQPLSSYDEGCKGKLRWWVASKVLRKSFSLRIDQALMPGGVKQKASDLSKMWRRGTIVIDKKVSTRVALKVSTRAQELRHEASMIQYITTNNSWCIPECVLYGQLLGGNFHVLILENFGRLLTEDDLSIPQIVDGMTAVLEALHDMGIMLNDFSPSNFAVGLDGQIKIVGLHAARLYRRLPEIAKSKEHSRLESMFRHRRIA